ncbi:MAG: Spy/CpxP family protein refolding chaperone [Candidatus Sericytochromatia bacterium]|nr:Spy/CpxP family protein refolding chaperone [Candidatus Sericytochromatia bacterium]
MRTRQHPFAIATAVAAAVAALGCANALPAAGPAPTAISSTYSLAQAGACGPCSHADFFRSLRLTAAQGHALRAAMKDTIRATNPMMALLRELTTHQAAAPAALSMGLDTLLQLDAAQDAHTLEQIRAVLTPPQRAQLAEAMRQFPTTHAAVLGTLAERATAEATRRLHLTPTQQALFAACARDYERFWQVHHEAYMATMARHLTAGGEAELRASLAGLADKLSMDSTAAFLASLSPAQGRDLVTCLDRFRHRLSRVVTRWTVAP